MEKVYLLVVSNGALQNNSYWRGHGAGARFSVTQPHLKKPYDWGPTFPFLVAPRAPLVVVPWRCCQNGLTESGPSQTSTSFRLCRTSTRVMQL